MEQHSTSISFNSFLLHDGLLQYVPPKRRSIFSEMHGVIAQKIKLFILTIIRVIREADSNLCIKFPTFYGD
jgi:hypothetical protein